MTVHENARRRLKPAGDENYKSPQSLRRFGIGCKNISVSLSVEVLRGADTLFTAAVYRVGIRPAFWLTEKRLNFEERFSDRQGGGER